MATAVSTTPRKLTLVPLVAATYFMVSGGPYGLEELVKKAGFRAALLILLVTPILWSLPTALMVGELSGAIPEEGGYYAWVKRAMGPFWGFQEAWLSLVASIFDMAIYPTLFVLYLRRLVPTIGGGYLPTLLGVAMIAACAIWNLRGARSVGGASVWMTLLLLAPFLLMAIGCLFLPGALAPKQPVALPPSDLLGGILVALWNYMGWDNASTIAAEVDRPQRTYPLAMGVAVSLVTITYLLPVAAVGHTGIDPSAWDTGSWVDVASAIGGRSLGIAVVIGGVVCAFGMFNALVLSYSRIPLALARDGYLPSLFARVHPKTGAPWVAIIACAVAWALALRLGFERLVELDVMLYGLSLLLEFAALVALRLREPALPRPFRVPGGLGGALLLGVGPFVLIGMALIKGRAEQAGHMSALTLGSLLIALGPLVYFLRVRAAARVRIAMEK